MLVSIRISSLQRSTTSLSPVVPVPVLAGFDSLTLVPPTSVLVVPHILLPTGAEPKGAPRGPGA
ncbi:hypothetical protein GCM10023237_54940 [Streptomyces coeruleoprunus]